MQNQTKKSFNKPSHEVALETLKERFFLKPEGENLNIVLKMVKTAIENLIAYQGKGPMYAVHKGIPKITTVAAQSKVPAKMMKNPVKILANLPFMVQGCVRANNPFMVKNLIPNASLVSLAADLAVSIYMPNAVTGEDAGQVLDAEIACAGAISRLAGMDPNKSAGVFTFGGTGTEMYAIKMGLMKAFPGHGRKGIRGNVVVVGSLPAHYAHETGCNWLGIGQENYLRVASYPDQTTKLDELESTCRKVLKAGKRIAVIMAVAGTTSNMGIDDIKKIYEIRERLVKEFNLPYKIHLHADAVLGWPYLNFVGYDFEKNPLGFSSKALKQIKKITGRIKTIKYADSFGVDFHKAGYTAYTASIIIVKNRMDLMRFQRDVDIMTPLFQDDKAYNPGRFTLETSRSAARILSAWIALQSFGREGYQVLLGHSIEMGLKFRSEINKYQNVGFYIANQEPFGCDTFIRCYKPGVDPKKTYELEMQNDEILKENNNYTTEFAFWLYKNKAREEKGFAVSRTGAALYTPTRAPMVALRIYPLNPYITKKSIAILAKRLAKAKVEFDRQHHKSRK
jgi:glutamate/tyrosine decarboxylase-like PLP-dependent enzyme